MRKTISIIGKSSFSITEANRDRSFTLTLKPASRPWLLSTIKTLIDTPLTHNFFREDRLNEYTLWVEKSTSRKGHCVEITKLGVNGGLNKIIIPVGENKWGWKKLASLLDNTQHLLPNTSSTTYKSALTNRIENSTNPTNLPGRTDGQNSHYKQQTSSSRGHPTQNSEVTEELASFNPNLLVLIFRANFHDKWADIYNALCKFSPSIGSISPIQPDRAILSINSPEQAESFCSSDEWVTIDRFLIRVERWSSLASMDRPVVPSYGGWIKLRNLPADEWSIHNFKMIGDICGGYVETAKKTLSRLDMTEVSIKVKSNTNGFLPANVTLLHLTNRPIITIEPFFRPDFMLNFIIGVHGSRRPQPNLVPPPRPITQSLPISSPASRASDFSNHQPSDTKPKSPPPDTDFSTLIVPDSEASDLTFQKPVSSNTHQPLAVPVLSSYNSNFHLPISTPKHPSPIVSLPMGPTLSHQPFVSSSYCAPTNKPITINNKPSLFLTGKLNSTSTNQNNPSDTDDFLSSHYTLSDLGSPSHTNQQPSPQSPPNLSSLFGDSSNALALIEDCLELPIKAVPIIEERPAHIGTDSDNFTYQCNETEEMVDASNYLSLLFPWMAKHGMCIMPIPTKHKQATAKKNRNWNKELQKLQSSVNYDKNSASTSGGIIGSLNSL